MASTNIHLLQKVTFEIGLPKQDGAFEIQNRISNAFQSKVIAGLEKLFDACVGPEYVVAIDKLEVNLGNLSEAKLETEITEALSREMEGFLATLQEEIRRTASSSGTLSAFNRINVRWSVPGKPHFEADVTVSRHSNSHFEKVKLFLQYGILPAAATQGLSERISVLINSVLENHPEELVRFLRDNQSRKQIYHRLALNLPAPQLAYVTALLGCSFSAALPALAKDLAVYLQSRGVSANGLSLPTGVSFHGIEPYIWWLLLVKYSGAGATLKPGMESATASAQDGAREPQVALLVELLLLTDRLSKRSFLGSNGKLTNNRAYQLPALLRKAVRIAAAQQAPAAEKRGAGINPVVDKIVSSTNPIFKDAAALQDNTLFALPDKNAAALRLAEPAEEIPEADRGIYISNAGLVLLAPFLKPFFTRLGLLEGKEFVSEEARWRAAHILQFACGFQREEDEKGWSEADLVFNKILCGTDIHQAVPEELELTAEEQAETEDLLKSVLHHWTIMSRSSVRALQTTFFQKTGRLSISGKNWDLLIERDSAVEILIDKLPWGISIIKLAWNEYSINTTW